MKITIEVNGIRHTGELVKDLGGAVKIRTSPTDTIIASKKTIINQT